MRTSPAGTRPASQPCIACSTFAPRVPWASALSRAHPMHAACAIATPRPPASQPASSPAS
eukprot:scaffold60420_cov51-Phaeocystis_antarctica.AAC.4